MEGRPENTEPRNERMEGRLGSRVGRSELSLAASPLKRGRKSDLREKLRKSASTLDQNSQVE